MPTTVYTLIEGMVDPASDGMRIDAFLSTLDGAPSRSACARFVEEGLSRINGTTPRSKAERVLIGDRVQLSVPVEIQGAALLPNPYIPLDIRFEDERIIVLCKQAGLVCHPSPGHTDDTLANALVAHCGYEHLGMLQGEDRPGIVHRLDRDTSGLMLAAKDDEAQKSLQDLIRTRSLDRRYLTLVHGFVAMDEDGIVSGIARSPRDRLRMAVSDAPDAREAITTYRVLERFEAGLRDEGYTLLECHLFTGRTHQIRVHMRHIGHPVVGDPLYGLKSRRSGSRDLGLSRQFLHSWRLRFTHPFTGAALDVRDALPQDLDQALRAVAARSMGRTPTGEHVREMLAEHMREDG